MPSTTLELDKVKRYFPFHRKCLVKVLLLLVNCMMLANTCNLNKIKDKGSIVMGKTINTDSLYIRFIRWFRLANANVFIYGIFQLIFNILSPYISVDQPLVLSMDRTNWQLGRLNINILMIGLVLDNGKFIPLYFELLNKKGNSNQKERTDLMSTFASFFSILLGYDLVLVGDREFIGKIWFCYLKNSGYDFVIRLRKKDYKDLLAKQMKISVPKHRDWSIK